MARKNVKTQWWGQTYALSADAELDLVDIIKKGHRDDSTVPQQDAAREAVFSLVASYAPLIEKIARERMDSRGGYAHESEDFIAEAYIVAIQCAYKFDPYKAAKPIRFSSYVSRAIVSALQRLNLKTHAITAIPVSTLSKARQWSYIYYDMRSKGLNPSDEEVSEICGVDMTQAEVSTILGATVDETLDTAYNLGNYDTKYDIDRDNNVELLSYGVDMVYGDSSGMMKALLGIGSAQLATTPSMMRAATGNSTKEISEFFSRKAEFTHHPSFRVELASYLQGGK